MAILKPCEIDFSNPPATSDMIISINDVPLGTQGNLLGITGGEGTLTSMSRKVFHICKRTLQRYRTECGLKSIRMEQKTYYRESDVKKFIEEQAEKKKRLSGK